MTQKIIKIITFLSIFFILITSPSKIEANTITLNENVFNSLVKDAKMMEVLSDEIKIYKDLYENSEKDFELLSQKHDELVLKYGVLLSQYETLTNSYDKLDKQNLKTIELQDKKIYNLERKQKINNWILYTLIAGGIGVSINNNENGAAASFAGVGLLYYYLNK